MNESNEPCGDMELRICDPRSIRRLAPRSAIQCVVLAGLIPLAGPLPAQQAPVVGTVAVKAQDIAQSGQFTGRVQAVDRVDVLPRVSGFLLSIGFTEGSKVSQGQMLFEIEPDAYQAAVTQIEGQIKSAQAEKALADIEVDRQQKLVGDQVTAENVLQQAQAKQGQAQGTLEELQGALQAANLNLSYTTITAPFDGRVGLTDMSVGAYVSEATGTMVTVSSIDPIHVTFPVSEARFLDFTAKDQSDTTTGATDGQPSAASDAQPSVATDTQPAAATDPGQDGGTGPAAPITVSITLSNGRAYNKQGTIDVVDTQVQQGTDTILVRASFPNPDGLLRDGQLVRVTLQKDTGETSLTIPAQALQRDQGGYFVFVLGDGNKVEKRQITFGRMAGAEVVVAGGLKEGEQVITEGVQRARPGEVVTPQSASAAPSAGAAAPAASE
ncbi:MAG: efflux transporter periplasmic adaptor subunit [Rhodobacteraceae bacterium]|nr:efflux transporter periplasmic adaptor subunit [Paracoccaceae bacterium]